MLWVRENCFECDRVGVFIYGNVGKLQCVFNWVDLIIFYYQLNCVIGVVFMQVILFDGLFELYKVVV